jgi:hypothetical protein
VGNVTRSGLTVEVGRSDVKRLNRLATTTGLSESELVGAALTTPEGVVDAATAYRLDQVARQLECLERDQTILIESWLCLFATTSDAGRLQRGYIARNPRGAPSPVSL